MKKFKFSFIGREVSAIGITYRISTTVQADNIEAAINELYKKYDHISRLKCNGTPVEYFTLER